MVQREKTLSRARASALATEEVVDGGGELLQVHRLVEDAAGAEAGGEHALDEASVAMFSRIRLGAGRVFDKPVNLKELATAVDDLLGRESRRSGP